MSKGLVGTAYVLFALCLIGSVAWPLWSDSDLWMLGFGALATVIILPVILWPAVRSFREAFTIMEKPPSSGSHTDSD